MSAAKRPRRLFAACHRCHSQKIKCSGEQPCRSCVAGDRGAECTFPAKERKIAVPERWVFSLCLHENKNKIKIKQNKRNYTLINTTNRVG